MSKNYLKNEFYKYLEQNKALLEEIVSSSKKYFFVWDYENQNHIWVSDTIWKKLGFLEENQDENLLLWKTRLNFFKTPKNDITEIIENNDPKLDLQFKNINEELIETSTAFYTIKNVEGKIIRVIGVLDNNWNNLTLNYSSNQFEILLNLYKSSVVNFDSLDNLQSFIVRSLAKGLNVSRSSVWMFEDKKLTCHKLFDLKKNLYEKCEDLFQKDSPIYYANLQKGIAIVANKAQENQLTQDLTPNYLKRLNIVSLLDVPIRENGKLVGILCCENVGTIKDWSENDISFARSIADIFSLFIEENKRREVEKRINIKNERFKFISENISDGIFIVENFKMTFASSSYLDMVGFDYEEKEKGQNMDNLHLVHPDDKKMVSELIDSALKKKLSSIKYVFRCRKKDGEYLWREDVMNIQHDIDDKPNSFRAIIIARDITEEKTVEIEDKNRKEVKEKQNKLLIKVYKSANHLNIDDKINYITEIAIEGLSIDRSNYWEVEGDKLVCKNLTDIARNTTDKNQELNVRDLPKYFKAMNTQTALIADDVMTNEFTSELIETYLKPMGITDMLDIPVRENGVMHGVLCFEHRDDPRVWSENDVTFARSLADFLSLSIEEDKRKKAEKELILNQEKLKFISENTSDGVVVFENSKVTYVSPVFFKLCGYDEEYIKSLTVDEIFEHVHPEDFEKIKKTVYDSLDKRVQTISYDYRYKAPDGNYYWREDAANILYNDDGTYSKYIIISRDINERKKTEAILIQNEQQLRLISENSSDGFVIMEDKKITYISPSYQQYLGYETNEIISSTRERIIDRIHPEDQQKIAELVQFYLTNRITSFKFEYRLRAKNGEYHWREDSTNVIYRDNSEIGDYSKYIIISRDIDERKAIESLLIESEQQLRLITENTSDGVAVIERGKLTYISPSYIKFLQYPDLSEFTIDDVFNTFHPDDLKTLKPFIYESLAKQKKEFKYELRVRDAFGNYHWREDSANVIYDDNGEYYKYIFVTRDISARKEAEKEKNRLFKITEKQNHKLINFTHIVSHDIRSHTSNLAMLIELFEESQDENEQKEYFNMLKESTHKLSDTIFYLNETVAVQSGTNNDKIAINLKNEIEKAIHSLQAVIKNNDANIVIDVDENLMIEVTQSYLESILFNLMTNAIKYKSPERKPIIHINAFKNNEDEIEFTITDNGIGINMEKYKDKIFGMYKTFHGNTDAVGLGLFMVKNQLESMGGRIEVESEEHVGTTFKLFFV